LFIKRNTSVPHFVEGSYRRDHICSMMMMKFCTQSAF